MIDKDGGYTPTPVISHAILAYNKGRSDGLADGVVITPSHNPPDNGGFKYNPPNGGPADTDATGWIADRANELLAENNDEVESLYYPEALDADTTVAYDFITPYVEDLGSVILADARALSIDGEGRVMIPPEHSAFAGIEDIIDPRETRPMLAEWVEWIQPQLEILVGPRHFPMRP